MVVGPTEGVHFLLHGQCHRIGQVVERYRVVRPRMLRAIEWAGRRSPSGRSAAARGRPPRGSAAHPQWVTAPIPGRQYSCLMTKNDPRMVPASFDRCRANLNRLASSGGTSIPSESLMPTARFPASATVYITLMDRPLS